MKKTCTREIDVKETDMKEISMYEYLIFNLQDE
jgi:hypothetical protein